MLNEIARLIESKTSFVMAAAEAARTLQVGVYLDTSPADCILVRDPGGGDVDFELPDRIDKLVQVIARAEKYITADAAAMEVFFALHGQAMVDLPIVVSGDEWVANVIEAVSAPQYIGPDPRGRHEFAANYLFRLSAGRAAG